eukprot:scaffold412_cov116-Isochrysis_galbana.AAC.2
MLGAAVAWAGRRRLLLAEEPRRRSAGAELRSGHHQRRRNRCGHGSQHVLPVVREQGPQATVRQRRIKRRFAAAQRAQGRDVQRLAEAVSAEGLSAAWQHQRMPEGVET